MMAMGLAGSAAARGPAANASMVVDLGLTDPFAPTPGAPYNLEAAGRKVFAISDPGFSPRVWVSDGTIAGTRVVAAPCGSGNCGGLGVAELGAAGSSFFFVTEDAAAGQVWMSDGTETGTRSLRLFLPDSRSGWAGSGCFRGKQRSDGASLQRRPGAAGARVWWCGGFGGGPSRRPRRSRYHCLGSDALVPD